MALLMNAGYLENSQAAASMHRHGYNRRFGQHTSFSTGYTNTNNSWSMNHTGAIEGQ